jgi:hypothetical protein
LSQLPANGPRSATLAIPKPWYKSCLRASHGGPCLAQGSDTLTIRSVEIVLREIELKREEDLSGCADESGGGDDDDECEEVITSRTVPPCL